MIPLSPRFQDRVDALFAAQRSRAREKKGPSGRISKAGYVLPFDKRQFTAWFLDQFGGVEGGVIRCRYCKKPIDAYNSVIDHATPLKRGGSPGLGNLECICEQDNQVKGGMTPDEFEWFLTKMAEMGMRFHGGEAVRDITSRLAKAVKLAAAMRYSIAGRQKQAMAAAVGNQEDF
jgi:5-methylcytosine-specific restriction endonuclease McrA